MAFAKKDLKADIIVDIATLTGAQGPATGNLNLVCNGLINFTIFICYRQVARGHPDQQRKVGALVRGRW